MSRGMRTRHERHAHASGAPHVPHARRWGTLRSEGTIGRKRSREGEGARGGGGGGPKGPLPVREKGWRVEAGHAEPPPAGGAARRVQGPAGARDLFVVGACRPRGRARDASEGKGP